MSVLKFIFSCIQHFSLPPTPQTAAIYSSLRKLGSSALLNHTHLDRQQPFDSISVHNSSNTATALESPISLEFCSWVLSFCNSRSLKEGACVHSVILKMGIQHNLFLSNSLLSLYTKCFGVDRARNMFDEMPYKDVVSWTGIISACGNNGKHEEALELFDMMLVSGLVPNEFTFSSVLRACSSVEEFELGACIHSQIIKMGFESNSVLGSVLIHFYSKCNCFIEVYEIFECMKDRDTICWTSVISAFVEAQEWSQSLRLYLRMIEAGVYPNEFTFVKVLGASTFLGLEYGKIVHAHVIIWGVELNLVLRTALIDMYSKCHRMIDAVKILNQMPESDVWLWTAIISGFTQNSDFKKAVDAFQKMAISGVRPNNFTYAGILSACSMIPVLELGQQIHSRVIMLGLERDASVGNALVHMYMKLCTMVGDALQAFRGIISPNVISWTSLIVGFAQHGFEHEAFHTFMKMRVVGVEPNSFTLSGILRGCTTKESLYQARKLHAYFFKCRANADLTVANAFVEVYARLGMVDDACNLVSRMSHRDEITYTSLATGMNQMGHHEMALKIIAHMQEDDVKMDGFSLSSFLSASSGLAAMESGKQLHCYSVKSGLGAWISVSNGLIDLYGKCGHMQDAHKAFVEIPEPDIVSWNGLIFGLASNGNFSAALSGFEDMRLAGIQPDNITFLLLLYACSHGGLVDAGLEYFQFMSVMYGLVPQLDHYVCLLDLLGRAGRLEDAMGVIETMPFNPDAMIYKTLLASCRMHRNVTLGEDMARRAIELDPTDPAIYVLLASMYDDIGKPDLAERARAMMRKRGIKKNTGWSWMEIKNKIHVFTAGDRLHPQINEIHENMKRLIGRLKGLGYPYYEISDSSYHSEKLAVVFGLLNTPSMAPIRIIKNIRICRDCHVFMKLVTQVVDREIVIRDGNRFHSFKNGECSCKGYW